MVAWAKDALAELEVADQIRTEVTDGMESQQREFLLRRQLDAIRKELGDDEDGDVVGRVPHQASTERDLPDAVREAATRELDRLERTSDQSPEHGWIRTWLDTLLEMPVGRPLRRQPRRGAARRVLDADHTGLDDVKDRIVEFLAVRKPCAPSAASAEPTGRGRGRDPRRSSGPPGVGKTSLGESVARALGRPFTRVALGGVHDEAEIRGHRRTYVGARPGRIVRALTEAGTMNPVIVLDEVDKLGADWRGDPSSALLEVLDPAQNHTFRDHYLEVDLDLSQVLFLATANLAETIPGPLLDRLEVIHLDGYTEDEKVAIARDHLLARQLERNGLRRRRRPGRGRRVAAHRHRLHAGGRRPEPRARARQAAPQGRGAPRERRRDPTGHDRRRRGDRGVRSAPVLPELAGARPSTPGVATGLAVTGTGGDVLFIEATAMDGDPGLTLTGQLGDVMKESAQIALSYVQGHAEVLGVDPSQRPPRGSTCTCPRARSRRTARRPASP